MWNIQRKPKQLTTIRIAIMSTPIAQPALMIMTIVVAAGWAILMTVRYWHFYIFTQFLQVQNFFLVFSPEVTTHNLHVRSKIEKFREKNQKFPNVRKLKTYERTYKKLYFSLKLIKKLWEKKNQKNNFFLSLLTNRKCII